MTSMMIAFILAVLALAVQGSSGGMSYNLANFLSIFNGYYDDLAQYRADNKSHDYTQARAIPTTSSAIPGKTVLFAEWSYNGVVLNLRLCDIFEDSNSVIRLTLYNITGTRQYKPGEYKVEDLSKLKPENLERSSSCEAKFEPAGPGMYVGSWSDCRHFVNGKRALYSIVAACNTMELIIPRSATEKSSSVPYNLVLKGDKYKVPGAPDDFISPCR